MPFPKARAKDARKVGLLVLAALAVLAVAVFVIGQERQLFRSKNRYFVDLQNVSGLKHGNPVQLNGVDVGAVEEVILPRDPARKFIRVWFTIDQRYADRVRADSRAQMKTLGLLGDKFVAVSSGSPGFPVIDANGQIPAAPVTNVEALLASGEDLMDNVTTISHQLRNILGRVERSEGLLGDLTTDSETGKKLRESLLGTVEAAERIAQKAESGEGALPRLLNDRELADRLSRSVSQLEAVLTEVREGGGLLPTLIRDPAPRQSFQEILANLQQTTGDLRQFASDVEAGRGLLPKLIKDEEYGRQLTGELLQIIRKLDALTDKLSAGEGTAAKLINDPQVYDSINDILIGVNESKLLRWLIRNRQKAGIEKRYEDTRRLDGPPPLLTPAGTEPPPPPEN